MRIPQAVLLATSLFVAAPTAASAQLPAYVGGPIAEGMLPSEDLRVGDLFGIGGIVGVEPHAWSRVSLSYVNYGTGQTERTQRAFSGHRMGFEADGILSSGAVTYFMSVQPAVSWFNIEEGHATPEERILFPMLGLGLGARVGLPGPFQAEFRATNYMTYARGPAPLTGGLNEGGSARSRSLSHNPALQASVQFRWQRQERVARFDDLPLAMRNRFQPVRPRETRSPELDQTLGRSHFHLGFGEIYSFLDGERYTIEGSMPLGTVLFEGEGSHTIPSDMQHVVRQAAEFLKEHPSARVLVRGYSTLSDSPRRNLTIAERRGNRVRDQLIYFYDIEPYRVAAHAVGGDPEASDGDARRADILLLERRVKP